MKHTSHKERVSLNARADVAAPGLRHALLSPGAGLPAWLASQNRYAVDAATLAGLTGGAVSVHFAQSALSRLVSQERLVPLLGGRYAVRKADHAKTSATVVALQAFPGGALSGLWAMSYHGLIMESVFAPTVFSPAVPHRQVSTRSEWGPMRFNHLAASLMREGYSEFSQGGERIRVATPEKALLDHIFVSEKWDRGEMERIRLQPVEGFSHEKFLRLAKLYRSGRILSAAKETSNYLREQEAEYA